MSSAILEVGTDKNGNENVMIKAHFSQLDNGVKPIKRLFIPVMILYDRPSSQFDDVVD